jgi:hypothetical protein
MYWKGLTHFVDHPEVWLHNREAIRQAKEKPGTAYLPHEMLTPN